MGIAKGKTTMAFRSCENRGFHLKFANGWIVSVQFGMGNYCDNYDLLLGEAKEKLKLHMERPDLESNTAEVWSWNKKGEHYPEEPLAKQTVRETLNFINKVSRKQTRG